MNVTNAIYQHVDLTPVMTRLMELSQNNILGAFPGSNPYGFQADPQVQNSSPALGYSLDSIFSLQDVKS